jgi:hypothetical protein
MPVASAASSRIRPNAILAAFAPYAFYEATRNSE